MTSLHQWLAAIHLSNNNPRTFLRWREAFANNLQQLFSANESEWLAVGLDKKSYQQRQAVDWKGVDTSLTWATQANQHLITYEDPRYPALLKEIHAPPLLLYVKGDLALLNETQLAMVGSRSATQLGLKTAEQFAAALAQQGFVITSGLALGIDAASHRGAMTATGRTVAVCGTGLQRLYPVSNQRLAEDMLAKGGAIVSEFPLAMPATPYHFPRRNRIIAGMSVGVLVVEAAIKSGSLITAQHALEQGKEVFAIPGSIHLPVARGCHALIRQGAHLVETAQDVLDVFPHLLNKLAPTSASSQPHGRMTLAECDPACQQLIKRIDYEITPMDVIVWRSGLTTSVVSSMLLVLELKGYIESVPGGYIRVKVT